MLHDAATSRCNGRGRHFRGSASHTDRSTCPRCGSRSTSDSSAGRSKGKRATLPVILRVVRVESSYGDTIMAPPDRLRMMGKVMSGFGRLVGYPTGKELAASL